LLYNGNEIKKEIDGKRLYFDNELEFRQSASNKNDRKLILLDRLDNKKEFIKKFHENSGSLEWIHSKARFADLVEADEAFISQFNFDNFNLIFEKIKSIIDL